MNKTDHPAALPSAAVPLPAITETPGMQLLQTWVVKGRLRDQPTAEERALMGTVAKALSASAGKDVQIVATVDEGLIGGLVVKIGSTMIDTSIRSRLMALQNTMKEVG